MSLYYGVPTGIRTPVTAVKGRCPRPLDDGDLDHYKVKQTAGGKLYRIPPGEPRQCWLYEFGFRKMPPNMPPPPSEMGE